MYSIKLHHHPLSVCSMKVRLALEEKGLVWAGREIDIMRAQEQLDPWYLKLNPNGVIPTLEFDNGNEEVITDSARIIRFIATLPEGNPLLPQAVQEQIQMEQLVDLADTIDLQILSYARHPSMEKSGRILDRRIQKSLRLAEEHPELKDNYLSCAERSEKSKQFRVDAFHVARMEREAQEALDIAEERLHQGEYLLGECYSLADVIWTVVLSRLDLLGYTYWIDGSEYPAIGDYYLRMQKRRSYTQAQVQNQWWDK